MMINKTAASIFAIVASIGMLTVSSTIAATMQPAHALTRFFNCTTQVANSTHQLTFQDVNACYSKEFHSSSGVGTGTTITTGSGVHGNSTPHHHHGFSSSSSASSSSSSSSASAARAAATTK
ncbi:MAG: hypothetical protein WCF03_03400 [Nitrososphaeraceae archaeon]